MDTEKKKKLEEIHEAIKDMDMKDLLLVENAANVLKIRDSMDGMKNPERMPV